MVGKPWEAEGLHCWRLTQVAVRLLFGVVVPEVLVAPSGRRTKADLFNTAPERAFWTETKNPGEWAVALMARRGAPPDLIEHAGVYLDVDGGGVLHTDHPHGVVFDSLFILPRVRTWAHPIFLIPRA
jgi:hypothetical protein